MTIVEEETRVAPPQPRPEPPPMVHRLCCYDHSKIICGTPRKDGAPAMIEPVIESTDCIVCDDIWDTTRICPASVEMCTNSGRMRGRQ